MATSMPFPTLAVLAKNGSIVSASVSVGNNEFTRTFTEYINAQVFALWRLALAPAATKTINTVDYLHPDTMWESVPELLEIEAFAPQPFLWNPFAFFSHYTSLYWNAVSYVFESICKCFAYVGFHALKLLREILSLVNCKIFFWIFTKLLMFPMGAIDTLATIAQHQWFPWILYTLLITLIVLFTYWSMVSVIRYTHRRSRLNDLRQLGISANTQDEELARATKRAETAEAALHDLQGMLEKERQTLIERDTLIASLRAQLDAMETSENADFASPPPTSGEPGHTSPAPLSPVHRATTSPGPTPTPLPLDYTANASNAEAPTTPTAADPTPSTKPPGAPQEPQQLEVRNPPESRAARGEGDVATGSEIEVAQESSTPDANKSGTTAGPGSTQDTGEGNNQTPSDGHVGPASPSDSASTDRKPEDGEVKDDSTSATGEGAGAQNELPGPVSGGAPQGCPQTQGHSAQDSSSGANTGENRASAQGQDANMHVGQGAPSGGETANGSTDVSDPTEEDPEGSSAPQASQASVSGPAPVPGAGNNAGTGGGMQGSQWGPDADPQMQAAREERMRKRRAEEDAARARRGMQGSQWAPGGEEDMRGRGRGRGRGHGRGRGRGRGRW